MLTARGWLNTLFIACIIIISGLKYFLIYPLAFLILGSLISRLNPQNSDNKGRNHKQVLANAGFASFLSILYLISPNQIIAFSFVLNFAVALSDTFSSEIGKRYGKRTINITTFAPINSGLSGGISFNGTIGGLIGSGLISIIFYLHTQNTDASLMILTFGFIGMLIDSILGSLLQSKYMVNHNVQEKGKRSELIAGIHWIDNDVVNFLSIMVTIILYVFVFG